MGWKDSYTAVDTETTGVGPSARVVDVAFVKFERRGANYEVVDEWDTLLDVVGLDTSDPDVAGALRVNGLQPADLAGKPKFGEVADKVLDWYSGVVVGHNHEFDHRLLSREFQLLGRGALPPPALALDTLVVDFGLRPGYLRRRLSAVCGRWGVKPGGHRALSDATASGQLLALMAAELPDDEAGLTAATKVWEAKWREVVKGWR